jgi:uncharacterized protein (DUF1778 family)
MPSRTKENRAADYRRQDYYQLVLTQAEQRAKQLLVSKEEFRATIQRLQRERREQDV